MNDDFTSAPGAWGARGAFPAYDDVMSGKAECPDIPVLSADPLHIPAPPQAQAASGAPTTIQVTYATVNVTPSIDTAEIRRVIEEREREQARTWVMMSESGVSF